MSRRIYVKKYFKVTICILAILAAVIIPGCGKDSNSSSSDMFESEEAMQSSVKGTYRKQSDLTNGEYTSTLKITSTTLTETATSKELNMSIDKKYDITEWQPQSGLIILDDDSIISLSSDGTLYYESIPYVKSGSSASSSSSTQNSEDGTAVLQVSDIKITNSSYHTTCTGSLKNTGSKTYKYVKVKGSFKDANGNVIDTDSAYAVGSEGLEPGESTTFDVFVTKNSDIKSCDVTVYDYDCE
ncbi:MAG: FxLYD domain-containing protein [Prevotella sp.]|nr:FxLYD domain-containing protein [Prevotella sp.]